ncbi:unknown [Bacteroides sp. CAG:875]|nr:unknown [Bacteroides sp. CAG:875]
MTGLRSNITKYSFHPISISILKSINSSIQIAFFYILIKWSFSFIFTNLI